MVRRPSRRYAAGVGRSREHRQRDDTDMTGMRRMMLVSVLCVGAGVAGCATPEEWKTWREHPTHWASGDHGFFSLRNREGKAARVTRNDIAMARDQGWWGKPLTVDQAQILER